jgi:methionyl aminopeptidase
MWDEPQVPNYGAPHKGPVLRPGMALAIEPMINEGTGNVKHLADDWTVVTADLKLSAHFEHSVVITSDGPELLTALD